MIPIFDGLDVLYHRAKFGEDRTTRAGCRCQNRVFVCLFLSRSEARALFVRWGYTLSRFCVAVYGSTLIPFSQFFFRRDYPFKWARYFSFLLLGGASIFWKLRSKL